NTPTPMRNAREAPECLPEKPSMILAIPLIRNAIPMNIIMIKVVATGYDIAIPAKIRTSIPSPIFDHLDFPGKKIPPIICSIPTKNKTIASIKTTEIKKYPGKARANMDKTTVIAPKPICTTRNQVGELILDIDT
ncbi:MAG: hypothetical protein M3530_03180, partial [Thermoproteota archaeon]|nr:hypothetical protein [Thermoproteota archaeon]